MGELDQWMTYTGKDGIQYQIAFDPKTRRMFLNGEPVLTEKRFTWFERGLAIGGLLIALVGVVATCFQAWAAWLSIPPHP
jgi:hypothetical protein